MMMQQRGRQRRRRRPRAAAYGICNTHACTADAERKRCGAQGKAQQKAKYWDNDNKQACSKVLARDWAQGSRCVCRGCIRHRHHHRHRGRGASQRPPDPTLPAACRAAGGQRRRDGASHTSLSAALVQLTQCPAGCGGLPSGAPPPAGRAGRSCWAPLPPAGGCTPQRCRRP